MTQENKINKMMTDINKILYKYENRIPKIKGVSGLSVSDLEECLLRLETMKSGYYRFMKILNKNIIELFNKYGIDPEYNNLNIW